MPDRVDEEFLTRAEFETLRRATRTYREELVLSLAGRVGLRPTEIAGLCLDDLSRRDHRGETHHLLTVGEGADGSTTRLAYVPSEVASDLRKFANSHDRDPSEPLFDVGARRLQMLVRSVAERTDSERLQAVSSRDLRHHYARRLLDEGIDPAVTKAVGGWNSLESLDPYLDSPSARDVLSAFSTGSMAGTRDGQPGAHAHQRYSAPTNSRTTDLVRCIASLGASLEDVSTREEVETAACDALTDCFQAVWVCDDDGNTRSHSGTAPTPSDTIQSALESADVSSRLAAAEGGTKTARDAVILPDVRGVPSLCVVALRAPETVHGFLCVATATVDDDIRRVLADAGRRIGRTLTAVERKRLLLADTGVELTFRSTDRSAFLVDCSAALGCELSVEGVVPVAESSLLHFVSVRGAGVGAVLEQVEGADEVQTARLVRDYGDHALLEFVVGDRALAPALVGHGGSVRSLRVADGVARVESVFSGHADVRSVVEAFTDAFPDSELVSKQDVTEPIETGARIEQVIHEDMTDKQRSVLRAAFLAGYFEWPRGSTAEELADSMGVASPTLHNHLRKAQQKVFTAVFDEAERPGDR
ncbi:bacterio-opsin activator domain-containing protein [Haloarchaeobius sp. TZWWS8]|uniref:bacterio-opsin activator domain-containing protein n=1 Tax=Haloarchaeobius sp. TZWWS8 TaxID=3446121 RepID=UPI003EBE3D76